MFKRLFCNHDYEHFFITKDAKMGGKVVVKDGLNCGSSWICKKCGKTKTYISGF
jgi:hypothetical protein